MSESCPECGSPVEDSPEITPYFGEIPKDRFVSFCGRGDSGALVALDSSRKADVPAFGLLTAHGTLLDRGYAIPLSTIFKRWDLRLWT